MLLAVAESSGLRPTVPVQLASLAQPELIEQWYREKGMLAFRVRGPETVAPVQDILVWPVNSFADLLRDAEVIEIGEMSVPVASVEHLIAIKRVLGAARI